jgi:hypothetical protein
LLGDLRVALPAAAPLLDAGLRDISFARDVADLVVMNTFKLVCKLPCDQAKAASCGARWTSISSLSVSRGSSLS